MKDTRRGTNPLNPPDGTACLRALIAVLFLVSLLAAPGLSSAGTQDAYGHNVPAPVVALASSHNGDHLAVLDEESRYTFLLDAGERERSWKAPAEGYLSLLDPTLGEIEPRPVGITMTPDGEYWAGATAYSGNFGGRVHGFAHWSDEPIWTYQLPDGDWDEDAVQPTVVASGGKYHAVGTTAGKVHVLKVGGEDGTNKKAHRNYKESNDGQRFGPITDVAVSHDGGLFLIGTHDSNKPSLHLYTDIFFKATFTRVTQPVESVALSADGTRGAAITGTGQYARVHFLDTTRGTTIWEHTVGSNVNSLSLSENGRLLAVGMDNGNVHLYEEQQSLLDSEPRRVFTFDSPVTSLQAADDGYAAVAATENGRAHLLDLRRANPLWSHEVPAPAVAVTISGDQQMITVGSVTGDEGRVTYLEAKQDLEYMVPPTPRLLPGQTQEIPLQLANNGNRMESLGIQWRALPNNWEGHESNLTLAPGETGKLGAKLTLPAGQPQGDYELRFDLVSRTQTIPFTVEVRVPEVTSGHTTIIWSFEKAVPGGAPAAFLLKLHNTGNTLNELALGYSGLPSGWDAAFTGSQETKLRPGEDRQVVFTVRAPAQASVGDEAWLDLVVAWQHGEEREPLRVELVDPDTYKKALRSIQDDDSQARDEGMDTLLDQLFQEAEKPVVLTSDDEKKSALIPFGGIILPLGAVAAALAILLLVVRRKGDERPQAVERAEIRRK